MGLCLPRGAEMIAAILGVWRAGAAYLPIDGALPVERIAFMLADSRVRLVLGREEQLGDLPVGSAQLVALDDPLTEMLLTQPAAASRSAVDPASLAYVIYTSGSTGKPKGVGVTHGSLANYVGSVSSRLGWTSPGTRYALLQPQVTDLGNTVVFASLATGGSCMCCPLKRWWMPRLLPPIWRSTGSTRSRWCRRIWRRWWGRWVRSGCSRRGRWCSVVRLLRSAGRGPGGGRGWIGRCSTTMARRRPRSGWRPGRPGRVRCGRFADREYPLPCAG